MGVGMGVGVGMGIGVDLGRYVCVEEWIYVQV